MAVERIGRRYADQEGNESREKGDLQTGQDRPAERLDGENIGEPVQRQPLGRKGQVAGVAERGAQHDDQRADKEDEDENRQGDQDRVDRAGHQVAIGLRRRARRVITSTMAMVMTTMMAAIVEALTQSKVTMAC